MQQTGYGKRQRSSFEGGWRYKSVVTQRREDVLAMAGTVAGLRFAGGRPIYGRKDEHGTVQRVLRLQR